jgi:hypothetical protein
MEPVRKIAGKVTKICMDIYRKLEKSKVFNIIEGLQIHTITPVGSQCVP